MKTLLFTIFILLNSSFALANDYDTDVPAQGGAMNSAVSPYGVENEGGKALLSPSGEQYDAHLSPRTGEIVDYLDKGGAPATATDPIPTNPTETK